MLKLSADLNRLILKLAPRHSVSDYAPSTYLELVANSTSSLVVWSGASIDTIYGDARINHAFRAWHDSMHLKLNADFTLQGEIRLAKEQVRQLRSDNLGAILMAEIEGQAKYLAKYGSFPTDQYAFIEHYLKTGMI